MAHIEPLVRTDQLKFDVLSDMKKTGLPLTLSYDDAFDVLMGNFGPNGRHVVHYLHGDFAVLVEPDSLEIVGFWLENFKGKFLVRHPELQSIWTVSKDNDDHERKSVFLDILQAALNDAHEALDELLSKAELVHELEEVFA